MQTRKNRKYREGGFIALSRVRHAVPHLGSYVYSGLIAVTSFAAVWVALSLSTAGTFAEIRPALAASLGPLAAFFGGKEAAVIIAVEAPGQVIALNDFDVAATVSGRLTSIAKKGQVVTEGDLIARFDDTAARAALRGAEAELASARASLAQAQRDASQPAPPPNTNDLANAFEAGYTALSDAHINFTWIVSGSDDVMNGRDIKDSQSNSYAYVSLIETEYPQIRALRDKAAADLDRAQALHAKARVQYEGMTRSAPPEDVEAAMNSTYDVLLANADALKSIGAFLAAVRENHEEAGLTVPEPLAGHQQSIMDAQVTTNDNIEGVRNTKENLVAARAATTVEAPAGIDLGAYERAVADAQRSVEDARANLARYEVRSPIAGTVAEVAVPQGSSVLDGQILVTIMTDENVARVAVSEANIGSVHEGDPVDVRFDGAEFSLAGTVLSVDTAATVSDGKVSFMTIVGFNDNDPRVRPGMTVTARIAK